MNNRVVYNLHYAFHRMGFTVLRFNFRGVGRSQGEFDQGVGELSDAAAALDYLQAMNPNSKHCWVAGFSFGAWIGMQLLMRRPEITGFVSVSPPANMYDFSFLAPCPSSGIIINGANDEVVNPNAVQKLVDKLRTQKHITIHHDTIKGANHFFEHEMDEFLLLAQRVAFGPSTQAILDEAETAHAEQLRADGLLTAADDAYVLTDAGRLLADGVVRRILG
mgnify:CR=1 FL=1